METWGMALVVLAAVLVGAAIPTLIQLRATLRAMEKTLQRSGSRLDEALGATSAAATRIDALVARVEEGGRIEQVVDGIATASRMVSRLQDTARVASAVGAAVGPAVAAAVRALREDRGEAAPAPLQAVEADPGASRPEPRKQAMP